MCTSKETKVSKSATDLLPTNTRRVFPEQSCCKSRSRWTSHELFIRVRDWGNGGVKTGNDPTTRSYKNDLFTNEPCDHRQNDLPVSEPKNTLVLLFIYFFNFISPKYSGQRWRSVKVCVANNVKYFGLICCMLRCIQLWYS